MNAKQILPIEQELKLHELKNRVIRNFLDENPDLVLSIQLVANDAVTIASLTPLPLLVLPLLIEEKVEAVIAAKERKEEAREQLKLAA
jgi:hypothetical protein